MINFLKMWGIITGVSAFILFVVLLLFLLSLVVAEKFGEIGVIVLGFLLFTAFFAMLMTRT